MDMEAAAEAEGEGEVERDIERLQRALAGTPGAGAAPGSRAALLDAALALNEEMSGRVERLQEVLERRLGAVRARLEATRRTLARILRQRRSFAAVFKYHMCGTPYFRDKEGNQPPPNNDTLHMRVMGTANYFFFHSFCGWTVKDKSSLRSELLTLARHTKQDKLTSELATLSLADPEQRKIKIQEIREELNRLNNTSVSQLELPIDDDFNWDDISVALKKRHSASECCGMWRLLLHPSINQNLFTKLEQYELGLIVHKYNCQDWDAIALELGSGRSGFQCFVHFRSTMVTKHYGARWSKEEDNYLTSVINSCRCGNVIPWSRVASYFESKTKLQIYNRWMNSIRPELTKGKFLPEEDAVLLACIDKFGLNFSKASWFLPQRSTTQLRNHYEFTLSKDISVYWTEEEDIKLLNLMSHFSSNDVASEACAFSAVAKHFPNKDRTVIRPRYLLLLNWVKMNPMRSLKSAPRRAQRGLNRVEKVDLATAVDNLAKRLELETARRLQQPNKRNVDMLLTEFFNKELCHNQDDDAAASSKVSQKEHHVGNYIPNMRRILLLLMANLDRKAFSESEFASKYAELLCGDPDICFKPKLRTYSKKKDINNVNYVSVTPSASIWDDSRTYAAKYILPPCYSTLAACRTIMLKLHELKSQKTVMLKKPTHIAYKKFLERCEILFTWPMILSNLTPKLYYDLFNGEVFASNSQETMQVIPDCPKAVDKIPVQTECTAVKSQNVRVTEIDLPPPSSAAQSETLQTVVAFEDKIKSIEYVEPLWRQKRVKRDLRGILHPGYRVVVNEELREEIEKNHNKKIKSVKTQVKNNKKKLSKNKKKD